jgi:Mus7/MMS22 family
VVTSHDANMLGANEILIKLSRRVLQYLLNGGFEPVQQAIRRTRGGTTDGGGCDSILLDIWSTLYHILNNPSNPETFPQFWRLVESELEIANTKDAKLLDRAWYTILNISPTTLFDTAGISQPRTNRPPVTTTTIWSIVETLITPFLQSYSAAQHHRYDAYIRTLLGRCHTLIAFWGWSSGAKTLLTTIYTFFTERRFDNLKTEALTPGFPKFFQSDPTRLEIHTSDNTFIIFLKLIVSYIALESGRLAPLPRRDRQAGWKDLDRFVNRIIPLRTYQASFTPLDYIALQNHYCLMVTLYWIAPERSRPSVERMRDVIDIEMAPAPAQVICLDTWKVLAGLMIGKGEELEGMKEWFEFMFRHAMKELRGVPMEEQSKSKMRNLESVVVKGMLALTEMVPLAIEGLASLVEGIPSFLWLDLI